MQKKSDLQTLISVVCPSEWKLFESHCYRLFENKLSWPAAEVHCQQEKGHLTSINSNGENNFLYQLKRGSPPWLGINDIHTEGNWVWSDGSAANFVNWHAGEPNNNGNQDCGQMYNGRWDDDKCQELKSFICKMKGKKQIDLCIIIVIEHNKNMTFSKLANICMTDCVQPNQSAHSNSIQGFFEH